MLPFAFLPNLGTTELMVVAFVALLIFGNRLPSVMRSLGKSVTEFKKGVSGIEDDLDRPSPPTRSRCPATDDRTRDDAASDPRGPAPFTSIGGRCDVPHLGPMEMLVVMGVAVLLFGKRLPEVAARSARGSSSSRKACAGSRTSSTSAHSSTSRAAPRRAAPPRRARTSPRRPCPSSSRPTSAPVPQMEYQPQAAQD